MIETNIYITPAEGSDCQLTFVYKSRKGAVSAQMSTGWHMQRDAESRFFPRVVERGKHSYVRQTEGDYWGACQYLDDGICYYDGTGSGGIDISVALLEGGTESVWHLLANYYFDVYGEEPLWHDY